MSSMEVNRIDDGFNSLQQDKLELGEFYRLFNIWLDKRVSIHHLIRLTKSTWRSLMEWLKYWVNCSRWNEKKKMGEINNIVWLAWIVLLGVTALSNIAVGEQPLA